MFYLEFFLLFQAIIKFSFNANKFQSTIVTRFKLKSANKGVFLVSGLTFESFIRNVELQVRPVFTVLKSWGVEGGKIQNLRVVGDS
jgi:hypothetical protein